MSSQMNEVRFAQETLRAYLLYVYLARHERVEAFRQVLVDMAETAKDQFDFWALKTGVRGDTVSLPWYVVSFFRIVRMFMGLGFTARIIVGKKKRRLLAYQQYCTTCTDEGDRRRIDAFVLRMQALVDQITTIATSSHDPKK